MRRIAIVHDWLVTYAGAERVLEQILICFPDADVFTLFDFLPEDQRRFLRGRKITTTWLQKLPSIKKYYRNLLPLMPHAIRSLDVSAYDLVISSSHAVAKGIVTRQGQLHLSLCYTPIRYVWDLRQQYLVDAGLDKWPKRSFANYFLDRIQRWDRNSAKKVDAFIAISECVRQRISDAYGRDSSLIYPPVDCWSFAFNWKKSDFYLAGSRLVPYKNIPLIIRAFNQMPDKKLVVFGAGPEANLCRSIAGSNVEFVGFQSQNALISLMQRAKAYVFAAEEDFGITPLEAQACGTPVIAYSKGAIVETIRGLDSEMPSGVLFKKQSVKSIIDAVEVFETIGLNEITAQACRENALRFDVNIFKNQFKSFVEERYSSHVQG